MRGMGIRKSMRDDREKLKLRELSKQDWIFLRSILNRHLKGIIIAICLTTLTSLFSLIPPLVARTIIDDYIVNGDTMMIIFFSLILILLYTLNWGLTIFQTRLTARVAQNVIYDIRNQTFEKVLSLSIKVSSENKRGEMLSVLTNDVDTLSEAFTSGIINFFSDILSLVGIFIIMFILDVQLTLASLIIIPLLFFGIKLLSKKIKRAYLNIRKRIAELNANVEENLAGIRVVQALSVEKRNIQDFGDLNEINLQANMKAVYLFALLYAIVSINSVIGIALVVGYGGIRSIVGGITLGTLTAFLQYITQFIRPFVDLANLYNTFQSAAAALTHINYYIQKPIDIPEPKNPIPLPDHIDGEIEFRHVDFSYTDQPLMKDVNLIIKSHEKIGIVGETGAGKTTLINLITRLYDVNKGGVFIDGINIKSFRQKELHTLFAVVSQNVVLFSDSIMNNIRFGNPDASDEDVIQAAKMARAHSFIEKLPDKYETKLGERGIGVSGGQQQLLAYARMLLANPKIVILDESTSNIDSYTENQIQQEMQETLEQKTTLIIAHRFATLQSVDRLILIRDGTIVDSGTHLHLLEHNNYYRELYANQFSKN